MHARSERFNQEAWLEAWTELDKDGFRYTIVSEKGSEYVRNKVLKAVLKREQELVADGECRRSEINANNYEFQASKETDGERHVILKAKRKDVLLVDGHMVLSQDGSELLRVEGRLSKNPSFWTSLVNVDPSLRAPRRRPRAGLDGVGRESEVRRDVDARGPLRIRDDQRPPRQPGRPPDRAAA